MTTDIIENKDYTYSLALQDIHRSLSEGRRRLRAAGIVFEGRRSHSPEIERLLRDEAPMSVVDVLDRVLSVKK